MTRARREESSRGAEIGETGERKPASGLTPSADAHALADRLERNQRPQSEQAMAAKLIRALLAGRAAGRLVSIAPLLNTSSALFLLGEGGREALRRAVTCKETPPACHLGGTFF